MRTQVGTTNALYPSLTTIIGATVDDKPNFITIAHVGIMNHGTPQYISFGMAKAHYTNQGIHKHKEFSVNIPSEDQMVETDYAGLVSGKNWDKSGVFAIEYGKLSKAPMIASCPVSMECKLAQVVDFPTHDVFVGEIVATYAQDSVLKDQVIDIARVKPLLFDMSSKKYWGLGPALGDCWREGKAMKRQQG